MRSLFHVPLCPYSRKVRLTLGEKKIDHELIFEPIWKKREELFELNPAGAVPIFVDLNEQRFCGSMAICEYLDEIYVTPSLLGSDALGRAEVRRLVDWFDGLFAKEVTYKVVYEKVMKRLHGQGGPDSALLRVGMQNIHKHMDYMTFLLSKRTWLAGENLSFADLAAAGHISCLDFIGHVPWESYDEVREWYARLKSRPSFRSILTDKMPGITPAPHYALLDF